jgi:hypothetical protein
MAISVEPIDEDWTARFFKIVEGTNEEMQTLGKNFFSR